MKKDRSNSLFQLSLARFFFLAAAGVMLFLCDLFSKSYVHENIPLTRHFTGAYPYGGIPVFRDFFGVGFSINHVLNQGAAWGVLSSFQIYLLYLRMVLVGGVAVHLLFFNRDRFRQIPFLLIIAGAIGNIVDYYRFGAVVDMFYFTFGSYSYPLFNLADSAICIGVALLLIRSFTLPREKVTQSSG